MRHVELHYIATSPRGLRVEMTTSRVWFTDQTLGQTMERLFVNLQARGYRDITITKA